MNVAEILSARLIGTMFVERGFLSESQIRVALEIQRETGQQLGQILVDRFGISRQELASVVAEQWADIGKSTPHVDPAANESWRKLGEIFVERGFVTREQLDQALERQRETGERVGEALVAQGSISKFELAGALAEQQSALESGGGASGTPAAPAEETNVVHLAARVAELAPALAPAPEEQTGHEGTEPVIEQPVSDVEEEPAASVEEPLEDADEPVVVDPATPDRESGTLVEQVTGAGNAVDVVAATGIEPDVDAEVGDEPETGLDDMSSDDALTVPTAGSEPDSEQRPERATTFELVAATEPDTAPTDAPADAALPDLAAIWQSEQTNGLVDLPDETPEPEDAWVAFASTTSGYRLVHLTGPVPAVGTAVHVPDAGELVVLRRGPSPIPLDRRTCVFLEQPIRSDAAHG